MRKNVAGQIVGAQLTNSSDGTAVTSGTTTVYVTGDGGTQGTGSVGSGACTHKGRGFWVYAPAQAETDFDHVAFTFVNTSAINATVQIYPSTLPTAAELLATAVDGSVTVAQSLRLANAALGGKAAIGTTSATFRDLADTKNRIAATVDADGNRTAVTRDLT